MTTTGSLHIPQQQGSSSSHEPMFTQTVSCMAETECRVTLSLAHVSTTVYRIMASYLQSPPGCIVLWKAIGNIQEDVLSYKKQS